MSLNRKEDAVRAEPAWSSRWTRRQWMRLVAVLAALTFAPLAIADNDNDSDRDRGRDQHWVASWATAPATFFVYAHPVPPTYPPGAPTAFAPASILPDQAYAFPTGTTLGATNQTIRSIVKPDLWGHRMRVKFSNVFGTQPVTFSAVTVGLQEYGANVLDDTITPLRFGGRDSVTIPAGTEVWSDGVALEWVKNADDASVQGRNIAISYAVQGNSGPMTYHAAAHQTSYVSAPNSGDRTRDTNAFGYPYTTTSWYFVREVDVMAPADTVVVCAFGDSITDGSHSTLSANDRWEDVLSKRLHEAYGNRVSVVNEGIGGNRVVNPVVANSTAGPAATDRLDRDVLALSGLTHVVWLEGINDLGATHTPAAIIAGYQEVGEAPARERREGDRRDRDVRTRHAESARGMEPRLHRRRRQRSDCGCGSQGPQRVHPHRQDLGRRRRLRRGDGRSGHRQHARRVPAQQRTHATTVGLPASQSRRLSGDGDVDRHPHLPAAAVSPFAPRRHRAWATRSRARQARHRSCTREPRPTSRRSSPRATTRPS